MSRFGFSVVTALGVFTAVLPLSAQQTRSIQCPFDLQQLPCSSDADCSRVYREHLCRYHPEKCEGSGDRTPTPNPARAPILGGLAGAFTGAAIGGAIDLGKTEEQKQADKEEGKPPAVVAGAAIGAGLGVMMGLGIKAMSKYSVGRGPGRWVGRHVRATNNPFTGRVYIGFGR